LVIALAALGSRRVLRRHQAEVAGKLLGVLERGDSADLADQADGGQRVDAAHAAQPRDRRRPRALRGLLKQQLVEAIAAREQHFVVGEVLAEDQLDERVVKANRAQPPQMAL
jgi:hypothetical protein